MRSRMRESVRRGRVLNFDHNENKLIRRLFQNTSTTTHSKQLILLTITKGYRDRGRRRNQSTFYTRTKQTNQTPFSEYPDMNTHRNNLPPFLHTTMRSYRDRRKKKPSTSPHIYKSGRRTRHPFNNTSRLMHTHKNNVSFFSQNEEKLQESREEETANFLPYTNEKAKRHTSKTTMLRSHTNNISSFFSNNKEKLQNSREEETANFFPYTKTKPPNETLMKSLNHEFTHKHYFLLFLKPQGATWIKGRRG